MPTHHQKLHPLDRPATRRDVITAVQKLAQSIEYRLRVAGIPPLPKPTGDGNPTLATTDEGAE